MTLQITQRGRDAVGAPCSLCERQFVPSHALEEPFVDPPGLVARPGVAMRAQLGTNVRPGDSVVFEQAGNDGEVHVALSMKSTRMAS